MHLCVGGYLLWMSGRSSTLENGQNAISNVLTNGMAMQKFQAMLEAQGVAAHVAQNLCSDQTDYFQYMRPTNYQTVLTASDDGKKYKCCNLSDITTGTRQHNTTIYNITQ